MSFSRRDFIALIGTSVAGAAALAVGNQLATDSGGQAHAGGIAAADDNWTVQAVGAVHKGAMAITLVHNVTREQLILEACRRATGQQDGREAVASSKTFDLFLANQGNGHKPTPRQHVIAARALARRLDQIGVAAPQPLLTMNDRLARHGELFDTNDDAIG